MIQVIPSRSRGHIDHGWLDTRHTFSFGHYHDPRRMGFRALRVINEDVIAPGKGFGKHFHDDMEILTYVLDGELEHRDNTGGGGVIVPGTVQRMTAGRGIIHSEFNHSATRPLHLLQIWILPERTGLDPGYEERRIDALDGGMRVIASRDGRDGSLRIHQDVTIFAGRMGAGTTFRTTAGSNRGTWVQVARGEARIDDTVLRAGDGAAIEDVDALAIDAVTDSDLLVFDLA